MEEKERYEYFFGTNTIKDNINKEFLSYKRVIDTLNQQDKRVKELEQENQQLKQQLAITEKALELACQTLYDINFKLYNTEMDFKEYFKQQALTHQHEDKGE